MDVNGREKCETEVTVEEEEVMAVWSLMEEENVR